MFTQEQLEKAVEIYKKKFKENGFVTDRELGSILRSLGLNVNDAEAEMLLKREVKDETRKLEAEAEELKEEKKKLEEALLKSEKELEAAMEALRQRYHLQKAGLGLGNAKPC